MSIVQMPITGRTSGKFATAVFAKNYQKNTMRAKALPTTVPATNLQTSQRTAFGIVLRFCKLALSLINIGFFVASPVRSFFSSCMSFNLKNAIEGLPGFRVVKFAKLIISQGNLTPLTDVQCTIADDTGAVAISWGLQSESDSCKDSDSIFVFMYNEVSNEYVLISDGTERQDLGVSTLVPVDAALAYWHLYIFASGYNLLGKQISSNTVYAYGTI